MTATLGLCVRQRAQDGPCISNIPASCPICLSLLRCGGFKMVGRKVKLISGRKRKGGSPIPIR